MSRSQLTFEELAGEFFGLESEVVLLPAEPCTVYAYWDVADDALRWGAAQFDAESFDAAQCVLKCVLRFYNITHLPLDGREFGVFFDVPVEIDGKSAYISLGGSSKAFFVELGLEGNGCFVPLVRSNVVKAPSSGSGDECWKPFAIGWDRNAGAGQAETLADTCRCQWVARNLTDKVESIFVAGISSPR